ncbi:MAG: hypothetical protein GC159_09375 [Phycisphaera sp.]|nr:hypothetical protein [Phycisphaera sp.]
MIRTHTRLQVVRLTLLSLLLLNLPACADDKGATTQRVAIGGKTFTLELMLNDDQRAQGEMGRKSIDPNGGMLFVFPDAAYRSFWMKNCLVDIDLIYLDARGRVVQASTPTGKTGPWVTMVPPEPLDNPDPPGYPSQWPAQFAIELKGGAAAALNLKEGDQIDLPLDALKQRAK